jgi:hypothetical protein
VWCFPTTQQADSFGDEMKLSRKETQDFWARVDVRDSDKCWKWKGSCDFGGYGLIYLQRQRKVFRTHRIAWELFNKKSADGFLVCHSCDNPPCCNPKHLWLGTNADNVADMMAKGRVHHPDGEKNGNAHLTRAQVRQIRKYSKLGYSQKLLTEIFGVSQGQISGILLRKYWKH